MWRLADEHAIPDQRHRARHAQMISKSNPLIQMPVVMRGFKDDYLPKELILADAVDMGMKLPISATQMRPSGARAMATGS